MSRGFNAEVHGMRVGGSGVGPRRRGSGMGYTSPRVSVGVQRLTELIDGVSYAEYPAGYGGSTTPAATIGRACEY